MLKRIVRSCCIQEFCVFGVSASISVIFASAQCSRKMQTKYILHIGSTSYELCDDDLKNWDEVRYAYTRSEYGGIERSFSSQFEFVNKAYKLLFAEYIANRFNSKASIEVKGKNSQWEYVTMFQCELDFSTVSWDPYVFKINAIDNSLAALIKANKSTKYEFSVDTDIIPDTKFRFDRIPMLENLTYEFTQGESYDENSSGLDIKLYPDENPFIGNVGSEISINRVIDWNDDQTNDLDSYLFKAVDDTVVTLDYEMIWRDDYVDNAVGIYLCSRRNGETTTGWIVGENGQNGAGLIALIADKWQQVPLSGTEYNNPSVLLAEYPTPSEGQWALVGGIVWKSQYNGTGYQWTNTLKTREEFFTETRSGKLFITMMAGDEVYIKSYFAQPKPQQKVAKFRLLRSNFTFTWVSRGQSVDIPVIKPQNLATKLLNRIAGANINVSFGNTDTRLANTYIMAAENARNTPEPKIYSSFSEFCDWMSAVFGYVYYVRENTVHFAHRSQVLKADAGIKKINESKELQYSVDSSAIYSAITAGYDKKDYDNINGRDEFNFNNTYTTGCAVSDKKLSLLSKYRADSYGIEFAVQKRNQDTTDSSGDKDVFFIHCTDMGGYVVPNRAMTIQNALSDAVFNAAFSPMACIRANAGLIGLQADQLTLTFASSVGNSGVIIGDTPMSGDLVLDTPLATCGTVEFTTDDIAILNNTGDLIEVEKNGVIYRGFMKDAEFQYTRTEAVKCKIIVKEIVI